MELLVTQWLILIWLLDKISALLHVYITFYRFQEILSWKADEEHSEKKFNHLYGVLASLGRSCVGATYLSSSIVKGIWEKFIMTTALLFEREIPASL